MERVSATATGQVKPKIKKDSVKPLPSVIDSWADRWQLDDRKVPSLSPGQGNLESKDVITITDGLHILRWN